ncbi:MAG: NlpC/P60 family protein [Patulibacter minatonensis]
MRRPTLAVLGLLMFVPAGAHAASGGGATVATPPAAAQAPASGSAAANPLLSQPLTLTKTQVRSVQKRLRVRTDGVLGSGTRAAIRRFQKRHKLVVHGKPDVETLRALGLKVADRFEARLTAAGASTSDPNAVPAELPAANDAVLAALASAQTRIGDPYRSGGTQPGGFDCSGLTVWAFKQAGLTLPRTSFQQYSEGVAIPKAAIQAGDLVFFDSAGAGASHVGIATGPTKVISSTTHGVMEHRIDTGYWANHYVGARRITA